MKPTVWQRDFFFIRNILFIWLSGKVAGVNLLDLNQSRVLLSGDQTIYSELRFTDDVLQDDKMDISGLVNQIDLSTFNVTSPSLNETELDNIRKVLRKTLSTQCKSLTYVKQSLAGKMNHVFFSVLSNFLIFCCEGNRGVNRSAPILTALVRTSYRKVQVHSLCRS